MKPLVLLTTTTQNGQLIASNRRSTVNNAQFRMTPLRLNATEMARVTCPCGNPPPPGAVVTDGTCADGSAISPVAVSCVTEITRVDRRFLHTHGGIQDRADRRRKRERWHERARACGRAISTFPAIDASYSPASLPRVPRRLSVSSDGTCVEGKTSAASVTKSRGRFIVGGC